MQVNNSDGLGSDGNKLSAEFEQILHQKATELKKTIEGGDLTAAAKVIQDLQQSRDQSIYQEVGRLTRALHDAIRNFHIDNDENLNSNDNSSDMSDASDRLSYVVDLTEKAANKTMDLVDECIPIASDAREELSHLRNDWQRLVERELSADEFRTLYWRVDQLFKSQDANYETLQKHFTEILIAQDYQDLTGQVIHRVTSLVREVESSLLELVRIASHVDTITGFDNVVPEKTEADETESLMKGQGPQIKEDESVVSNQDDVDDLSDQRALKSR